MKARNYTLVERLRDMESRQVTWDQFEFEREFEDLMDNWILLDKQLNRDEGTE